MSDLKPTVTLLLEAVSLFGSGIATGFMFYITFIELPGRKGMPVEYQLKNYHQVFPRAAAFMEPLAVVLPTTIGATLYLTEKQLLWIPLVMIGALGPLTAIFIVPTNKKLMATPVKEANKVKEDIAKWERLHNYRTYMSLIGFAGAVAAALHA